jgi:Ca-activated chloride channel family protein
MLSFPSLRPRAVIPLRPLSRPGRLWAVVLALACLASLLLVALPAQADDADARRAESPYFFVKSDDPSTDRLPLKATEVDARIAGPIADVTVTQRYRNEGQRPIEARYVFPGSTQAAVHGMTVRIGQRVIVADIREKQRARIEFDAARREGKTAALLEQERPNVFSMNVANILPGDEVAVELRYTELLPPTEGRYQFVFPTVVGPRYRSPANKAAATEEANGTAAPSGSFPAVPYLPTGEASDTRFDLRVAFASPLPVSGLRSSSHEIEVEGEGSRSARVALGGDAAASRHHGNRDFILDYRLSG